MSDATSHAPSPPSCGWPTCTAPAPYLVEERDAAPWHACEDHATQAAFVDATVTAVDL